MFKTPPLPIYLAAVMLVAAPGVAAIRDDHPAETGVRALEGRGDSAATAGYAFGEPSTGRQDPDPGAAPRTTGVYGDTSADSGALPLAQFARGDIKAPPAHGATGFRALVARVRDGGLPEPASWALMLIGFGMIGGVLRGFVVANRRLAGLQPEDTE